MCTKDNCWGECPRCQEETRKMREDFDNKDLVRKKELLSSLSVTDLEQLAISKRNRAEHVK